MSLIINILITVIIAAIVGLPIGRWILKRKVKKLQKNIPSDIQEKINKEKIKQKEVENDRTRQSKEYFIRRKEEQRNESIKGRKSNINRDITTSGDEGPVEESRGMEIPEVDNNARDFETIELHKPSDL